VNVIEDRYSRYYMNTYKRHADSLFGVCSVVTLGDLTGSVSDVDISVSSRPASRSSSLDTCGLDQQQLAQAKAAAQAATMVMLSPLLLRT